MLCGWCTRTAQPQTTALCPCPVLMPRAKPSPGRVRACWGGIARCRDESGARWLWEVWHAARQPRSCHCGLPWLATFCHCRCPGWPLPGWPLSLPTSKHVRPGHCCVVLQAPAAWRPSMTTSHPWRSMPPSGVPPAKTTPPPSAAWMPPPSRCDLLCLALTGCPAPRAAGVGAGRGGHCGSSVPSHRRVGRRTRATRAPCVQSQQQRPAPLSFPASTPAGGQSAGRAGRPGHH